MKGPRPDGSSSQKSNEKIKVAQTSKVSTNISPTFISTDLLSPHQSRRLTIPWNGTQVTDKKELGGKTWGENVTNYGGIGKLPFLGRARARDLYVSRGHKHYASCLTKYVQNVQPHRVTPLTLSECRINDQILPGSLKVALDPADTTIPNVLPKEPYFSHKCKFEVFPCNDPDRVDENGEPMLSANTRDALHDYYKELKDVTRYERMFPDYTEKIKEDYRKKKIQDEKPEPKETKKKESILEKIVNENLDMPKERVKYDIEASFSKAIISRISQKLEDGRIEDLFKLLIQLRSISQQGRWNMKDQSLGAARPDALLEELIGICMCDETDEKKKKRIEFILSLNKGTTKPVSPTISQRIEQYIREELWKRQTQSGIPHWPPSSCYFVDQEKWQLKDKQSFETDEKLAKTRRIEKLKFEALNDEKSEVPPVKVESGYVFPGLPRYKKKINRFLPVMLKNSSETSVQDADADSLIMKWYNAMDHAVDDAREEKISDLPPLPLPLACSLEPTGNRVQDRLGLRFKTAAHRRFHSLYKDPVPDPREPHITRKKYFFYGFHASCFR